MNIAARIIPFVSATLFALNTVVSAQENEEIQLPAPTMEHSVEEWELRTEYYEATVRALGNDEWIRIVFSMYGTPHEVYQDFSPDKNNRPEFASLFQQQKDLAHQIVSSLPPNSYENFEFDEEIWSVGLKVNQEGLEYLYADTRVRFLSN